MHQGDTGQTGLGWAGGGILHQGKCHTAGSSRADRSSSCKRCGESGNRRGPGQEKEVGARSVSLAFCLGGSQVRSCCQPRNSKEHQRVHLSLEIWYLKWG